MAQEIDFGTTGEEEPSPDDEKPYDPNLPYSSENDPGTDQAPAWEDVLYEPAPVDPSLVSLFDLPEGDVALEPKDTPFPAAGGCGTFTGTVTPLQLWSRNPRYFSFQGRVKVLLGVSADNGAALWELGQVSCPAPPIASPVTAMWCTYERIFDDAAAKGLNRTRLWVVLPSEPEPRNHIFEWDLARGIYRFDRKNQNYLDQLRAVVERAKLLNMFVEVTFFSPGTSINQPPRFVAGPWGGGGRYSTPRGQTGPNVQLSAENFPFQADFVRATTPEDPKRLRMQEFQKNVVDWVVDALWCHDNVWWEIANEPEGLIGLGSTPGKPTVAEITDWQKRVIGWVRAAEARHSANLPVGHPIAVNPFTAAGAAAFLGDPQVSVVEGHYTTIAKDIAGNTTQLDQGSIQLLRNNRAITNRVLGSNEDKITPLPNATGTESHRNTTDPALREWGAVEPARAGAWEAMFHQAGTFDHFGYSYKSVQGQAIRNQFGKLREFMVSLPLGNLRPAPLLGTVPPGWLPPPQPTAVLALPGLVVYPIDHSNWEGSTGSSKYWAALATAGTATGRTFVAYFHHSAPRCMGAKQDFLPPNQTACNGNQLVFQGYDARIRTSGYRERLRLSLGASAGAFLVEWIDPATLIRKATSSIVWNPASGGTCTGSVLGGTCVVESPAYDFDLVLKVTQQ